MNKKIKSKDILEVISPSGFLNVKSDTSKRAEQQLKKDTGLIIKFGKNTNKKNDYNSSSIKERVSDLQNSFLDKKVKAILCSNGGFNSNELLSSINWTMIKANPKPIVGSSDNTVLINAIYAKTGMVTYFGPNFFIFGIQNGNDYTMEYFKKCLMSNEPYEIKPSVWWSNSRKTKASLENGLLKNKNFLVVQKGTAKGIIIGGNLCSLNLLQGTEYMPSLKNAILFIEDDDFAGEECFSEFKRNLHSLLSLKDAKFLKGIVLGRFPVKSLMTDKKINDLFKSIKELSKIPIIANVDFGHTEPTSTFPIGSLAEIIVKKNESKIIIHNN